MAVELIRSQIAYKPVRSLTYQPVKGHLKLVSNNQLHINASKAALNASMERAQLNQKYWEELLEKLRRAGGGGGGDDKRFDRLAVSMMLSTFLSNKAIQAMLRNFGVELFGSNQNLNQTNDANHNIFINVIQNIGKFIFGIVIGRSLPWQVSTATIKLLSNNLIGILGTLSFQLNKLKEILEEDLKEFVKKLDVKEKMKKIQTFVLDLFVEMKEELLSVIEFIKSSLFPKSNVTL